MTSCTEYGLVLETYLKDRARVMAEGTFQPLNSAGRGGSNSLRSQVRNYG
jgi:hypothetical protein